MTGGMKMITIGKPYITKDEKRAYLRAEIRIPPDTARRYVQRTSELVNCAWLTGVDYPPAKWNEPDSNLWFSVPVEYAQYLCQERSNAFVIALLWYAMVAQSDICFEAPMSQRLYDGLTQKLIPAVMKGTQISLKGPVTSDAISGEAGVVSGMSCGVDSLYTLHCYGSEGTPANVKLTHLMYCELDYLLPRVVPPYDIDEIFYSEEQIRSKIVKNASTIAERHRIPFLHIRSNLERDYYRGGYIYTGMYRYLACTLALERLFSVYIISSSGSGDRVEEISLFSPTQNYENLICASCGTEKLHYMISDHVTRVDKLKAIADDPDFRDFASVCFNLDENASNCGECYGCMKTMIPLDMLGKLSQFEKTFDTTKYYANRRGIFKNLIRFSKRPEASSARESVQQFVRLSLEADNEAGREFLDAYHELIE
jgi:hypothetical protein